MLSDKTNIQRGAVVVAGLSLNGATVSRRLALLGYDVHGVSFDRDEPGWHVRKSRKLECPNPSTDFDGWLAFMREFSRSFAAPPPILAMSDAFVIALDRAAPELEGGFLMHGFGSGLRTSLTSKRATFALAEQYDFPRPASRYIKSRDELAEFIDDQSGGSVLIKPDLTPQWRLGPATAVVRKQKVIMSPDKDELLARYDEVAPYTPEVLAQEVIPGDDSCLLYWCGFVGPEGRVGGRLVGRKHRVVPIHYGSATFVTLEDLPQVEATCSEFLVALGYQGLCGIELKEDPRDGIAKLIEVNPRYSLWDDIGIPVGVDLAAEAVAAFEGRPTVPKRAERFDQKWVEFVRDFPAFLRYQREGSVSFAGWIRSLAGPTLVNDLPVREDPGYAAHMVWRPFRKILRICASKIGLRRPVRALASGTAPFAGESPRVALSRPPTGSAS
jgi:predicted ATP-grasp superfamily ATP-dependent carboligase